MVKIFASAVAAAALLQSAFAHMAVISPPPRSGIVANELIKPCGGGNDVVAKNTTTFSVASSNNNFVLRPSHGTGNLIFNYFTDLTVTNNSIAHPLDNIQIPAAGTYDTKIDFAKAGLKAGQQIVVQAIYNGTDSGETEEYYVCFDVKLTDEIIESSSDSEKESNVESDDELDSVESTKSGSPKTAAISAKAVLGAAAGLVVAAFAF